MAIIGIDLGTSNSAAAVLRGKGLPRFVGRGRGDLYLRLAVALPERLTREERELWDKLRARHRTR